MIERNRRIGRALICYLYFTSLHFGFTITSAPSYFCIRYLKFGFTITFAPSILVYVICNLASLSRLPPLRIPVYVPCYLLWKFAVQNRNTYYATNREVNDISSENHVIGGADRVSWIQLEPSPLRMMWLMHELSLRAADSAYIHVSAAVGWTRGCLIVEGRIVKWNIPRYRYIWRDMTW